MSRILSGVMMAGALLIAMPLTASASEHRRGGDDHYGRSHSDMRRHGDHGPRCKIIRQCKWKWGQRRCRETRICTRHH